MIVATALLAAAQADAAPPPNPLADMAIASTAAIRAGGKACIGATVDPAGQDARLGGWGDATPAEKAAAHSDGRVLKRDEVLVIVKPGLQGGCVVMARADPALDKPAFYADLGRDIGKTIVTDPKNPVTELGAGEVLVTVVTPEPGANRVILVVGNTIGQAMKHKGN